MRPDFGPHFLVATKDEAATGAESIQLDGIDGFAAWDDGAHGLGPEDLVELHCLVLGRASDPTVMDGYEMVFVRDEMHGPWLVRMPDEFVRTMASLGAEQLLSIGEKWRRAATNGLQFRRAPEEWVQRLGIRLAQLARRAVEQNKCLYWEPPSC